MTDYVDPAPSGRPHVVEPESPEAAPGAAAERVGARRRPRLEVWLALPGTREASVHLALLPADADTWRDDALVERWTRLIAVRDVVNGALEAQRQAKTIGTSLEARVVVAARGETLALLRESAAHLDMLFIVSATEVRDAGSEGPELAVEVVRSDGTKCVRCWRYVHDISTEPAFAGLCGRCVEAVAELV